MLEQGEVLEHEAHMAFLHQHGGGFLAVDVDVTGINELLAQMADTDFDGR